MHTDLYTPKEGDAMSPKDRRKLLIVAGSVLVANGLDLASTYLASPDLADEWNVLERLMGLGWAGLICAKLIGGWFAIVGYAYYLRNRGACYPPPGANRNEFLRFFAFGKPIALDGKSQTPKIKNLLLKLGYVWAGLQGLILWVALDNVLISRGFVHPFRRVSELGYHLAQSAVVGGWVLARFYLVNYKRYQELTAENGVELEMSPVAA